jgi:hypothetical protein
MCGCFAVLEAGDLVSLLEQFEASEAFNTSSSSSKPSVLDNHLYAMATQQLTSSTPKSFRVTATPSSSPTKGTTSILSHQNIKDSLSRELVNKLKVSYDLFGIYFSSSFSMDTDHSLFQLHVPVCAWVCQHFSYLSFYIISCGIQVLGSLAL